MQRNSTTPPPRHTPEWNAWADHLCDLGLYLHVEPEVDALVASDDTAARLLGLRALSHLGARRISEAGVLRLGRHAHAPLAARIAALRVMTYRYGPRRAWLIMKDMALPETASISEQVDWHSLRGYIAGMLRDFENAETEFQHARHLDMSQPWPLIERSYVLEWGDRCEEALELAREALRILPGYRSGILALAHACMLLGRDDEALATLTHAAEITESGDVAIQLFHLQFEHGRFDEAAYALDRVEHHFARADVPLRRSLAGLRADLALRLGHMSEAAAYARSVERPFYTGLAERIATWMAEDRRPQRVELAVRFVRQNHLTCAPATLSALAKYWGHSADHLEIAEEITYDGTPYHSERTWAEARGFIATEFTADWDIARRLLDAGVPFALTTVYAEAGHLQAVVGYDSLRESLLIRDPGQRIHAEYVAQPLFESHRATGPRAMLLLPREQAYRLDSLGGPEALPDAGLWNLYRTLFLATENRDRDLAAATAARLAGLSPDHSLSHRAARCLAWYDGASDRDLEAVNALLANYPEDVNLLLAKFSLLGILGTRDERLALLAPLVESRRCDTKIVIRYAALLGDDGRARHTSRSLLDRMLVRVGLDATAWHERGNVHWLDGERQEALEHYRIATCLYPHHEDYASTYARTAVMLGRRDEAVAFLKRRVEKLGKGSSEPAQLLFTILDEIERTAEGLEVLDAALTSHPDDDDLRIFAAEHQLRYGRITAARELLDGLKQSAPRAKLLRFRARLERESALRAGDDPSAALDRALALAQAASAMDPFSQSGHRLVMQLLRQTRGQSSVLTYLRDIAERHPHHFGLQELLIDEMENEALDSTEQVLRRVLPFHPDNAWLLRELAGNLVRQGRHDEAQAVLEHVLSIAPQQAATHNGLGLLALHRGQTEEACARFRRAYSISADSEYSLRRLIEQTPDVATRRALADFVHAELASQSDSGDGILSLQLLGAQLLPARELREHLASLNQTRPDLWQSWVALLIQDREDGNLDRALEISDQAVARFPLLPRVHVERAAVLVLLDRRDDALVNLGLALEMSPGYGRAVKAYMYCVTDQGVDLERALAPLHRAITLDPQNADLRASRAWLRWTMGEHEAALEELRAALVDHPGLDWAWETLAKYAKKRDQPELAMQLAAESTRLRPGDPDAWLRLAEFTTDPAEALASVDRARQLEPSRRWTYERRLELLLRLGRLDELEAALAAPPVAGVQPATTRIFEARLARERGETEKVTSLLRALAEENPGIFWLWQEWASDAEAGQRWEECLKICQHMVELAPNRSVAQVYLGDALRELGRHAEAEPAFKRALEIDPGYQFAALALADQYLEEQRLDEAHDVLEAILPRAGDARVWTRVCRLALARNDARKADQEAKRILIDNDCTAYLFQGIAEAYGKCGALDRLDAIILDAVATGTCHKNAARHWADRHAGSLLWSDRRRVGKALRNDPARILMRAALDHLAETRNGIRLRALQRSFATQLRGDVALWGSVSHAWVCCDDFRAAERWTRDWRRSDAPAWALNNRIVALRYLRRHRDARAVTLAVQRIAPDAPDNLVWLLFDAALADQAEVMDDLLTRIDASKQRDYYADLVRIIRWYRTAHQARDNLAALADAEVMGYTDAVKRNLRQRLGCRLALRHGPWWMRPVWWIRHARGRVV